MAKVLARSAHRSNRHPAGHDFLVGISIDGPPEMHDAYRVDKGGKPTSARVLRGLDVLKLHGCGLERADHHSCRER